MSPSPADTPAEHEIREAKKAARQQARRRRQAAADRLAAAGIDYGAAIRDQALRTVPPPADAVVSGYWSLPEEADVRPLLYHLAERGQTCCLPVVVAKGAPLAFRQWTPDTPFVDGVFGIPVPPESAPSVTPDVIFAPLLAVDRLGYRLGFGGGFYDRTLAQLRTDNPDLRAYGVAFSDQIWETVPRDAYDCRLDGVVTESGVVYPEPA